MKAFEYVFCISDKVLTYLHNAKAELFIFRNSLAFISLFIYLYNIMLIVPYISSLYNRLRIVRRGWASLRFEGRDKSMSDYEIIMLLLQVLAIVIAFGALVALICLTKSK